MCPCQNFVQHDWKMWKVMHRKLYDVHTSMCQAPIVFKTKIQTLQTFFYIHVFDHCSLYMPSAMWELAFQIFAVQWKHQTHECKEELEYVIVHGLPDGYIKKASHPHLEFLTGTFTGKWQKFKKYFVERDNLYLVDSSIKSKMEKMMLNNFKSVVICVCMSS